MFYRGDTYLFLLIMLIWLFFFCCCYCTSDLLCIILFPTASQLPPLHIVPVGDACAPFALFKIPITVLRHNEISVSKYLFLCHAVKQVSFSTHRESELVSSVKIRLSRGWAASQPNHKGHGNIKISTVMATAVIITYLQCWWLCVSIPRDTTEGEQVKKK